MQIYIYSLIDPRNNKVMYIGKTKDIKKRYKQHCYGKTKNKVFYWTEDLKQLNMLPQLAIVEECANDNWEDREKYWISYYGLHNLFNIHKGGEILEWKPKTKQEKTKIQKRINKLTLERYLYLKGYTTQGTSYHKIKCDKGLAKAFKELFFDNLLKGDVLEFQRLVNELKELDYNYGK